MQRTSKRSEALVSEIDEQRCSRFVFADIVSVQSGDDDLGERGSGEGIDIARRTVAKYREAMRIPTSAQRRREKR